MSNIIKKRVLGLVVTSDGKSVAISAAFKTTNWTRTISVAEEMKEDLETAVAKNEHVLPEGTAEVCS